MYFIKISSVEKYCNVKKKIGRIEKNKVTKLQVGIKGAKSIPNSPSLGKCVDGDSGTWDAANKRRS